MLCFCKANFITIIDEWPRYLLKEDFFGGSIGLILKTNCIAIGNWMAQREWTKSPSFGYGTRLCRLGGECRSSQTGEVRINRSSSRTWISLWLGIRVFQMGLERQQKWRDHNFSRIREDCHRQRNYWGPSTRWVLGLQELPYEEFQVADRISNGAMYRHGILDEAF